MSESILIGLCGDILPVKQLELSADNEAVLALLAECDFSLGNFEMPITDCGAPQKKLLNIKASPRIAESLSQLKLNMVTLANNHAPDYGWEGLLNTGAALNRIGIEVIGIGEDVDDAGRCAIRQVGDIRVGVIAYSCLTPAGTSAGAGRPGISALHVHTSYDVDPWYQMEEPGDIACVKVRTRVVREDLERAIAAVSAARSHVDLLIASVHWGFGSTSMLADYQPELGRALIDAGADVVHGHHPHAVQPIGFHNGKPIIFSSNVLIGQQTFLEASDTVQRMWKEMSQEGFVTQIRWDPDGGNAQVSITPTSLDAQRLPTFLNGSEIERFVAQLSDMSKPFGGEVACVDGRIVVRPCETT